MNSRIDRVALRAGVPRATVKQVLGALADEALLALTEGDAVVLPGLGAIEARWTSERALRSVRDGRKVAIDGHYHAGFRAGARLREVLRFRTPQILREPAHQKAWRLAETLVSDLDLYHGANAPRGLAADTPLEMVDLRCAATLGVAWGRARRTYDEQTPDAVRQARDHLAVAARRRWAGANRST